MARAAVPGRLRAGLAWRVGRLVAFRDETPTARTLVLDVPGWPGHLAGQHVDVRLTAEDGYQTQRSYSIASPPGADRLELTVQRVREGEVSPYLTRVYGLGDPLELRGPVGGWFVWRPTEPAPVLLVAGGAGIVPLMAMIRTRAATAGPVPFHLVYSVRTPEDVYYAQELARRSAAEAGFSFDLVFTRRVPPGHTRPPARLGPADLSRAGGPAHPAPSCFVCGPTGFVEAVADTLVALGHEPGRVKTERFGPSGGAA